MIQRLLLALLLASCSEYDFDNTKKVYPDLGPVADLEPTAITDQFIQYTYLQSDILFVIDNSCSMANEQSKLISHFPIFMDYFVDANIDYHIGVRAIQRVLKRCAQKAEIKKIK